MAVSQDHNTTGSLDSFSNESAFPSFSSSYKQEDFDLNIPWQNSVILWLLRTELVITLSPEIRRHLPGEVIHCLLEKGLSDKFHFSLLSLSTESVLA